MYIFLYLSMLLNSDPAIMVETETLQVELCGTLEDVYMQHDLYSNGDIRIKRFVGKKDIFVYELTKIGKNTYFVKGTKIPMTWKIRKGNVIIVGIKFKQIMRIKNIKYGNQR